jgi:hypothetical protein
MIAASMSVILLLLPGTGAPPGLVPAAGFGPDTSCIVMDMPTDDRVSPLDSLTISVQGHPVKICYGRPSARGRTMIGGRDVPFGRLWRTGANEPTMIHTTAAIAVAGIEIKRGSYSLYTVPGEDEWVVIVNRSITQWGHIAEYSYKVKAQEVGKAKVSPEHLDDHVETMRFRAEPAGEDGVTLVLEWERTRVAIPVTAAGS